MSNYLYIFLILILRVANREKKIVKPWMERTIYFIAWYFMGSGETRQFESGCSKCFFRFIGKGQTRYIFGFNANETYAEVTEDIKYSTN